MNVFSRLCLGTANWGQPYGHRGVTCPREEQEKILAYAFCAGIKTIHTKKAYNVDLSWIPTAFEVVKTDHPHNASLYDPSELQSVWRRAIHILCIPYSPFDRRWEDVIADEGFYKPEIHARSIFCQGKVFTSDEEPFVRFRNYAGSLGIPPGTLCILFCLMNPNVDKVIIGADSLDQLKENLRFFHRLDSFSVDDPKTIDPRQWKDS